MMLKEIREKIDFGILGKIATIIVIVSGILTIISYLLEGIKVVSPFLTKIESFWLLVAVWLFTLFLMWINRREWEKKESELEEKTEQYDELVKHVKLPKAVDKAITVEVSPKWGISHPYKDIIGYKRDDKFPHLYFYMRVINRTYYYFEPEEVAIGCSFDNQDIGTNKWMWDSKIRKQETNIEVDNLREVEDGTIRVQFPIKELYNYSRRWKLDGTVIYKLKGSAIEANTQYTRPEIGIHLEYVLPEEQVMKLRKEVEKAIGDER